MENETYPISWFMKERSKQNRKDRLKNVKFEDSEIVKHELNESEYLDSNSNRKKNDAVK